MQDLRLAIRALRATPIVTAVAILSLALGIGANTAIFSLVNSLALKPLPVVDPQRLYLLSAAGPDPVRRPDFSYATYRALRRHTELFDGLVGFWACCGKSTVIDGERRDTVDHQFVTGDFFSTLGVRAYRGRLLKPDDDEETPPDGPVVVISHRLWEGRFGGREDVVGTRLRVDGVLTTVVGVAPPEFFGVEVGRVADLLIPQHLFRRMTTSPFDDDSPGLTVLVYLRPDVTAAAAIAALRTAQPQIRAEAMPKRLPAGLTFLPQPFTLAPAPGGTSGLRARLERPLLVVFAVVAAVLLMACANVGSLLIARGRARRHELSVRAALGASRWQVARMFLAESLILSAAGAVGGLIAAAWTNRAVLAQLTTERQPIALDTPIDWRVMLFTMAVMVVTAVVFGTLPAIRATAVAPVDALRTHGGAPGALRTRIAGTLIVGQFALCLLLVVAAGLFVRTFQRLVQVVPGFDRDRAVVTWIHAPTIAASERPVLFDRLTRTIGRLPGVDAAGGALNPPIIGQLVGDFVVGPPGVTPPPDATRIPEFDSITPRWFAAYGMRVERGRDFDAGDTSTSPLVMIVNAAFVRQLYPGRDVIGLPLALTFRFPMGDYSFGTHTVVGVVSDALHDSLRDPIRPMIYVPLAQREPIPQNDFYLAVRSTGGSPELLERSVATAIDRFHADLTFLFEPLRRVVDESIAQERVVALLASLFGALALLLAAIGLYGVTSYDVERHRPELGIRLALGARPNGVLRLVLSRVVVFVGAGIAIGAVLSAWASRFTASLLFEISPRDPVAFTTAAAALAVVAVMAAFVPAYRASRIDPAEVLRES